jgi:hypothetical protein
MNKQEMKKADEKKDGEHKEWHRDGKLYKQCRHVNGKIHSEYKEWWPLPYFGKLKIQCPQVDGKLHGEYKQWYPNDELEIHCHYKEGKEHGEYKRWIVVYLSEEHKLVEHWWFIPQKERKATVALLGALKVKRGVWRDLTGFITRECKRLYELQDV